jgi:pimeloyl-ACP methyl ester carboxylesterase
MTRLGVAGHSIGAASAIWAASYEPRIRALVSSAAFADPAAVTMDLMRCLHIPRRPFLWLIFYFIERWLGTTIAAVAPQNRISRITAPLLLIHGAADRFVPASNMKALCMRAPRKQTRCWLVPGRRHSDVILDPHFGMHVTKFLQKNLFGE